MWGGVMWGGVLCGGVMCGASAEAERPERTERE